MRLDVESFDLANGLLVLVLKDGTDEKARFEIKFTASDPKVAKYVQLLQLLIQFI